jgi:hypothetical protein
MQDYAEVTGNTNTSGSGGGVYLSGNSATKAYLIMSGSAKIHGNTTKPASGTAPGGGVYATFGDIEMSGNAQITGNTAESTSSEAFGGGVYLSNSTLTMSGNAQIGGALDGYGYTGNTAKGGADNPSYGGGVCVIYSSTFIMEGAAKITGNTATNNTSRGYGGGVSIYNGAFTMGGTSIISGNHASTSGGGVFMYSSIANVFTMSGGTIYGADAGTDKNTAGTYGASLYKAASARAWYGDGTTPILGTPENQGNALYSGATLNGHP